MTTTRKTRQHKDVIGLFNAIKEFMLLLIGFHLQRILLNK